MYRGAPTLSRAGHATYVPPSGCMAWEMPVDKQASNLENYHGLRDGNERTEGNRPPASRFQNN